MVSQADRELINNFVVELRPYLGTVELGVREFAQPNRDGVIVGQAVQSLMMIRGAGQVLMVDGLVSIASWLIESVETIQNNPEIPPDDAARRLIGLYGALDDYIVALDDASDETDSIIVRARTIYEDIPSFTGPLPGTSGLRARTDLDALFGEASHAAQTKRFAAETHETEQQLADASSPKPPTPAGSDSPHSAAPHASDPPARIIPDPEQPTEELPRVDPQLREIFEEEALEIVAALGDAIRQLAHDSGSTEAIRDISRAAHTLKGAANITGFSLIGRLGAAIELLFDEQIEYNRPVDRDVLELVAVSWKMLRAMIPNLDDLGTFTAPTNSIVQRADILREILSNVPLDSEPVTGDAYHVESPDSATDIVEEQNLLTDESTARDDQRHAMDLITDGLASEPFWALAANHLAPSGNGTDALIADIQGIAETPSVAVGDIDVTHAGADDLDTGKPESVELIDFTEAPQTEPFWSTPPLEESEGDTDVDRRHSIERASEPDSIDASTEKEQDPDSVSGVASLLASAAVDPEIHTPPPYPGLPARPTAMKKLNGVAEAGSPDNPIDEDADDLAGAASTSDAAEIAEPIEALGGALVELGPGEGDQFDANDAEDIVANRPGLDTLSFDRFLTTDDPIGLSSALLDMAFRETTSVGDADSGTIEPSISVIDESSERALAIEMFETFALEIEDHIARLNRAAMQLDRDPHAHDSIINIKRALHTIKGAAAAAEFAGISDLAHQLEDSLATAEREGALHDQSFTTALFSALDEIEGQLSTRKDELFGLSGEGPSGGSLHIDVERVDDLINSVGELVVNRSSFEERLGRLEATLEDLSTAAARLQRSSLLLEREAHTEDAIGRLLRGELAGRVDGGAINPIRSDWDLLELDRYTEFDRLIRQLAEVGADVTTAVGEINSLHGDFDTISTRQRRLTTALQDELMSMRMVPISSLAPRLYRVVRRTATQRGKEVSLIVEGGETPFDKLLLDTLSESLLHLLRNAVDHGIEAPDTRRKLGKPEQGTIRIRAFRDGSEAVIEIIDDGAGIDPELVKGLASQRGHELPADLTREDALLLIFKPGYTTRDEADDISGRGLGLEIVEQTVSRYKGRVAVDSIVGRGTVFSLRLPVMLSVIQAFLVSAGEGEFAIPVANIDYVVDRTDQPLTRIGDSLVVETGDQIIPVIDVGARIGRSQRPVFEKGTGWIMVTEISGKRWALVVDELHSQQEIVVKPMGRFLRSLPGLMGATILGHGDVAMIVDVPALLGVDALVTRLDDVAATNRAIEHPPSLLSVGEEQPACAVLVVDDSLSVRRVVSRTIERQGWSTIPARDGVEALELIEQGQADIVLTDIEMPRMDGFELVSAIRGRHEFDQLPVVVLTSRSGEKHRERALSLGANEYLVKPFQEQELIQVLESMRRTVVNA